MPLLEVDGEVVSAPATSAASSRAAPSQYAGELLGAPFVIDGEVVHGDKRGRELGYPTANLVPDDGYLLPGARRLRDSRADGRRRGSTSPRRTSACARSSTPAAAS